jgi:hypothetical protein
MDNIFDREEDKLPIVTERLAHLPFINGSNLKFDRREGYLGDGVFGYAAGPSLEFENLAHEMSHAIDCVVQNRLHRLRRPNWGIHIKSFQDIMGRRYFEPVTMQPTELECRVVGYQKHIMEIADDPAAATITETMADTLHRYMCDHYMGGKTDEERIQTRADLIEKAYHSITKSDISAIWSRVSQILYSV